VYAHKPEWAVGATSTLKRKPAAAAATTTVWKLDADEDGDLIDEDSLVSLAGVTKKPVAGSSCCCYRRVSRSLAHLLVATLQMTVRSALAR